MELSTVSAIILTIVVFVGSPLFGLYMFTLILDLCSDNRDETIEEYKGFFKKMKNKIFGLFLPIKYKKQNKMLNKIHLIVNKHEHKLKETDVSSKGLLNLDMLLFNTLNLLDAQDNNTQEKNEQVLSLNLFDDTLLALYKITHEHSLFEQLLMDEEGMSFFIEELSQLNNELESHIQKRNALKYNIILGSLGFRKTKKGDPYCAK